MICEASEYNFTNFVLSLDDQFEIYNQYISQTGDIYDSTKLAYLQIDFVDQNDYQYDLEVGWFDHFVNSVEKSQKNLDYIASLYQEKTVTILSS